MQKNGEFLEQPIDWDHLAQGQLHNHDIKKSSFNFFSRLLMESNVYGTLSFAETAESLALTRKALAIETGDCVVGATSSGDILLTAVAQGATKVIGFDMNPMQTALANLKLTAIQNMCVEDYMRFLGIDAAPPQSRIFIYNQLSELLPKESHQLFSRRKDLIYSGLLNCGMTYLIIHMITKVFKRLMNKNTFSLFFGHTGTDKDRLEKLDSFIHKLYVRLIIKPFFHLTAPVLKWFFFPRLICQVSKRPTEMVANFFQTFQPLFEHGILANPVLCRAASKTLHTEWREELYNENSFKVIRKVSNQIVFKTASIFSALAELPDCYANKVYISNIPDYLTGKELIKLSNELKRITKPGARLLYLSLSDVDRFDNSFGSLLDGSELNAIQQLDNVHI